MTARRRNNARTAKRTAVAALSCALALSACRNLGVNGGDEALAGRFPGIQSATVTGPTSVTVRWKPATGYSSYNIYVSTQDAPIGSSVFDSFKVSGLTPATGYSFSVSGVKPSGAQDGISKQIAAQTWAHFTGPSAAAAIDYSNVQVSWNYFSGPVFQIFYNAGAPPTEAQLKGTPNAQSTSGTGAVVGGLQPNTTYYFSVIAKYPDGTTSFDPLQLAAAKTEAQFTTSTLVTLPKLETSSTFVYTDPPRFKVSGAPSTYLTYIARSPFTCTGTPPVGYVARINANGEANATGSYPQGVHDFYVLVSDTLSTNFACAVLGGIVSSNTAGSGLPSVQARTPTNLSPLPVVSAPSDYLGNYPVFTVAGALPGYKTELLHGTTVIGSILGNGNITTLSSTPLPRGDVEVVPKVSYAGQYAELPPIKIRIRGLDPVAVTPPVALNGGAAAGVGTAGAVGDFNCDGFDDLALGAPNASFALPFNPAYAESYQNTFTTMASGGVVVWYGSASGLAGLSTGKLPVPVPAAARDPLLIPAPNIMNRSLNEGIRFGMSLAVGNFNGDFDGSGTRPCQDLAVGAMGDFSEGWAYRAGAVYIYYGSSPGGLQVTPYTYNGLTCAGTGSSSCGTVKLAIANEPAPGIDWAGWGGLGYSVGAGDFNGDGIDDLAAGFPTRTIKGDGSDWYRGAVYLFPGTPNGVAPSPVRLLLPPAIVSGTSSYMGTGVAMGYLTDPPGPARKKDLIIGVPNLYSPGGLPAPGVLQVKGTDFDALRASLGPLGELSAYTYLQPGACRWATYDPDGWAYTGTMVGCGYKVAAADLNGDQYDETIFTGPWLSPLGYQSAGGFFVYYGSPVGPVGATTLPAINQTTCTGPGDAWVKGCNPQAFFRTDSYYYWYLGATLSVLGDLNGDGLPEIGVGAPNASTARVYNRWNSDGIGYIYYSGDRGLSPTPVGKVQFEERNFQYLGSLLGGNFRNRTHTTGGCAGKKCNDLVVTAPGEAANAMHFGHGRAHVFANDGTGFATSLGRADVTESTPYIVGKPGLMAFDRAAIVGDINGDGYADVAASVTYSGGLTGYAMEGPPGPSLRLGLVVYYGGKDGLITSPAPSFTPASVTDPLFVSDRNYAPALDLQEFARWVAPAGDVDGDGHADVLVGSSWQSVVILFYGSAGGLLVQTTPLSNLAGRADVRDPQILSAGTTVHLTQAHRTTHGDFNGDHYSDIVISLADGNRGHSGVVIIYGSAEGARAGGTLINENRRFPTFATADPLNKMLKTTTCSGAWPEAKCNPTLLCPYPIWYCDELAAADTLGFQYWMAEARAVGDTDGDGTDDLLLTDAMDNYYGTNSGAAYLLYGSVTNGIDLQRRARLVIEPQLNPVPPGHYARYLGHADAGSLAKLGDVNGDGLADFAIGAFRESTGPGASAYVLGGAVYVFYGINGGYRTLSSCGAYPCTVPITRVATPDFVPNHVVSNSDTSCNASNSCNALRVTPYGINYSGYNFGYGVQGISDVTGDGFADMAVSSWSGGGADKIWIFSGTQSGFRVAAPASAQPTCSGGVCTPYLVPMPSDPAKDPQVTRPGAMNYTVAAWQGVGDVDKDGRKDFIISSFYLQPADASGWWTGGFFLFR